MLAADGPFLAAPVVNDTWPGGLPALDKDSVGRLREASALLDASPGTRDSFVHVVLADFLGWGDDLVRGPDLPPTLETTVPEHHTEVRPDFALVDPDADQDSPPRLLGIVTEPGTRASAKPRTGSGTWNASAADRLAYALRAQRVPLGLVTDGSEWTLVCAPAGGTTATTGFTRHGWLDEPDTLKAFHALLSRLRFFGVPDHQTLPGLLRLSVDRQEEITERLSEQSRDVVVMLVATIGRLDVINRERFGKPLLPPDVEPGDVYQAAVTVLMRLVFLLYAEERNLLPLDDDTYAGTYSASTLAAQLREQANEFGEDTLEQSSTAWHRILATSRAVHRGARHDQLSLPAYGGSLFDPDRFPWLEGRTSPEQSAAGADVLPVDDRTMLRALESLQWLTFTGSQGAERRRVSFQDLDVEQIGYVYEGLLDQDAVRADDWSLGIAADGRNEKNGPKLTLTELEHHLALGVDHFAEWLSPITKTGSAKRSAGSIAKALAAMAGDTAVEAERGVRGACAGHEQIVKRVLPFAGLLRKDPRDLPVVYPPGSLYLTDSPLRAHAGAIYTPRTLAETVVESALAPLVYHPGPLDTENRAAWKLRPPNEILDLKIIDIAAGSGAFLVGATRYLADQLLESRRQYESLDAEPAVDDDQRTINARRTVLEHCVYGVDINPMAVEMAKLSLWLVTLDRQRPFGFLDDRLAVGDSLLGLTSTEQLVSLHFQPDEGRRLYDAALVYWTADAPVLLKQAAELRQQIAAVELIDTHDSEHKARLLAEARVVTRQLTLVADGLSGASLAGGEDHHYLDVAVLADAASREEDPERRDEGWKRLEETARFALTGDVGQVRLPAHFPLLFPEAFEGGRSGFDAVIGNPPFLHGSSISQLHGPPYRNHLVRAVAHGTPGTADLVAYFFRRAVDLLDQEGCLGLIATNTLVQGDTAAVATEAERDRINIYRAIRSQPWGTAAAAVEVCLIWASRRYVIARRVLDGRTVDSISPHLTVGEAQDRPAALKCNRARVFMGPSPKGGGFVINDAIRTELVREDAASADFIYPMLDAKDVNRSVRAEGSRYVIYVPHISSERELCALPAIERHLRRTVKEQRDSGTGRSAISAHRAAKWWLFGSDAKELFRRMTVPSAAVVMAAHSPHAQPLWYVIESKVLFNNSCLVWPEADYALFGVLASGFHHVWIERWGSTLKTDLRYTPTDVFETFPLPAFTVRLQEGGEMLQEARRVAMRETGEGLTKLYNDASDSSDRRSCIQRLRAAHVEVDLAVAASYGWSVEPAYERQASGGTRFQPAAPCGQEMLRLLTGLHSERLQEQNTATDSRNVRSRRRNGQADSLFGGET
jgi:methylase of polypeptide subunit release factors